MLTDPPLCVLYRSGILGISVVRTPNIGAIDEVFQLSQVHADFTSISQPMIQDEFRLTSSSILLSDWVTIPYCPNLVRHVDDLRFKSQTETGQLCW